MQFRDEEYGSLNGRRFGQDGLADKSTPELLQELLENGRIIIGEEVRIARAELRDEAKKAGKAGAAFGAGGVLLHVALLCFAGCLIALGALVMPVVLSALIVAVLFGGIGAAALYWAKNKTKDIYPDQTVRTLKEDKEWAKGMMQSVRSERHASA
jgi:prepilin signal peptidase PulO-like enzyme (type II secretory pathway)